MPGLKTENGIATNDWGEVRLVPGQRRDILNISQRAQQLTPGRSNAASNTRSCGAALMLKENDVGARRIIKY
jgi:hypothetical protein